MIIIEKGFSAKQEACIELLGRGLTAEVAGSELGISPLTIRDWMSKKPELAEAVEAKKREFYGLKVKSIDERMNSLELQALDTLKEMLSKDKPDSVRMKAAQAILSHQNSRKPQGEGQLLVQFDNIELGEPAVAKAIEAE